MVVVENGSQIDVRVKIDGREYDVMTNLPSRQIAEIMVGSHNFGLAGRKGK